MKEIIIRFNFLTLSKIKHSVNIISESPRLCDKKSFRIIKDNKITTYKHVSLIQT